MNKFQIRKILKFFSPLVIVFCCLLFGSYALEQNLVSSQTIAVSDSKDPAAEPSKQFTSQKQPLSSRQKREDVVPVADAINYQKWWNFLKIPFANTHFLTEYNFEFKFNWEDQPLSTVNVKRLFYAAIEEEMYLDLTDQEKADFKRFIDEVDKFSKIKQSETGTSLPWSNVNIGYTQVLLWETLKTKAENLMKEWSLFTKYENFKSGLSDSQKKLLNYLLVGVFKHHYEVAEAVLRTFDDVINRDFVRNLPSKFLEFVDKEGENEKLVRFPLHTIILLSGVFSPRKEISKKPMLLFFDPIKIKPFKPAAAELRQLFDYLIEKKEIKQKVTEYSIITMWRNSVLRPLLVRNWKQQRWDQLRRNLVQLSNPFALVIEKRTLNQDTNKWKVEESTIDFKKMFANKNTRKLAKEMPEIMDLISKHLSPKNFLQIQSLLYFWEKFSLLLNNFQGLPFSSTKVAGKDYSLAELFAVRDKKIDKIKMSNEFCRQEKFNKNIFKQLAGLEWVLRSDWTASQSWDKRNACQKLDSVYELPDSPKKALTVFVNAILGETVEEEQIDSYLFKLDNYLAKIGKQLYQAYWTSLNQLFKEFKSILPIATFVDENEQSYSLNPLFALREIKDFANLTPEIKATFFKLIKVSTVDQLKKQFETFMAGFWSNLKPVLNVFPSLPNQEQIDSTDFCSLKSLFTDTKKGATSVWDLSPQSKFDLLCLINKKVQINSLVPHLSLLQPSIDALGKIFSNYQGVKFPRLLIKDRVYDLKFLFNNFQTKAKEFFWTQLIQSDNPLFLELLANKLTPKAIATTLTALNINAKTLWADLTLLLPFLNEPENTIINWYQNHYQNSPTFDIKAFFAEIWTHKKVKWQQIATNQKQFQQILTVLPLLSSSQIGDQLRQFLLWNPLQGWISPDYYSALPTKIVVNKQQYDLTALFAQKSELNWKNLDSQAKAVLAKLVKEGVTPSQLKKALGIAQKRKVIKNTALPLALITVGGSSLLIILAGLIYRTIRFRQ